MIEVHSGAWREFIIYHVTLCWIICCQLHITTISFKVCSQKPPSLGLERPLKGSCWRSGSGRGRGAVYSKGSHSQSQGQMRDSEWLPGELLGDHRLTAVPRGQESASRSSIIRVSCWDPPALCLAASSSPVWASLPRAHRLHDFLSSARGRVSPSFPQKILYAQKTWPGVCFPDRGLTDSVTQWGNPTT